MTPEQFTYWLQGFSELNGEWPPNKDQWKAIQEHLNTVFKKITPPAAKAAPMLPPPMPLGHQNESAWERRLREQKQIIKTPLNTDVIVC